MNSENSKVILLFDGVCNLCHGSVQFIIPRDPGKTFQFASLQSNTGRQLLQDHGLDPDYTQSLVLLDQGEAHTGGKAAARIAGKLKWPWKLLGVFQVLPGWLLNPLYQWVARNRYRWFGKKDSCPMPHPDQADRFLDSGEETDPS